MDSYQCRKIARSFESKDWRTRELWARRLDIPVTPYRIEMGLNDSVPAVCVAWIERNDWTPTSEQIERGLTAYYSVIVMAWLKRTYSTLTPEQIDRALRSNSDILSALLEITDWTPTSRQIARGLSSSRAYEREAWALCTNFTHTSDQVEMGLTDPVPEVRNAWITRLKKMSSTNLQDDNTYMSCI